MVFPWQESEISLTAESADNPYVNLEVSATFTHESGRTIRRPGFWDGGTEWKIRFAAPEPGRWTWTTASADSGLHGKSGDITVAVPDEVENRFYRHGFWRMSPGKRSLVHVDGRPAILVGDTAWALPWRATEEQVRTYAADRSSKGFNAVLLMSVQPDMRARGPRDRTADEGFDVGFEDLPTGHLNELNPAYFQYLDRLLEILVEHEIVPVLQPVFHGFGWKGLDVAGVVVPPAEYARYCRYLVARFGARPAIYLVGADGSGYEPQIPAGGEEVQEWDAYEQPTGIHYRPHADNRAWQDAGWLDFQWCQTGHGGEHAPERVADMWRNTPVKAVADGEPTYERTGTLDRATGWWQGHEAWSNLCAGGTMGVVYGAGSLWQWLLHPDETGQSEFFRAPGAGWREALDFEGSAYVGMLGKILDGLPTTDMEPSWQQTLTPRGLRVSGKLHLNYRDAGGPVRISPHADLPPYYRIVDPRTGVTVSEGKTAGQEVLPDDGGAPRVYICYAP